ncbi:hypothetical protein VTO42DRAFT_2731 [Malbranchea cinnamomea]
MRPCLRPRMGARPFLLHSPRYRAVRNQLFDMGRQCRNFHSPLAQKAIDASVFLAHGLLDGIHAATGLPWVASIPLTALVVRVTFGFLPHMFVRQQRDKKARLAPMLAAWRKVYEKQVAESRPEMKSLPPRYAERLVAQNVRKTYHEMRSRWKVYRWPGLVNLLPIFPWLAMMESLRKMVGMGDGLLGIVRSGLGDDPPERVLPLEPSMASEGALWFPDLLAHDTTFALPVMLSATLVLNVAWGWKTMSYREIATLSAVEATSASRRKGLKYFLMALSVWMCPTVIAAQVPSGMLVYWISSSFIATLQQQFVSRVPPPIRIPKPCRPRSIGSIHDLNLTK